MKYKTKQQRCIAITDAYRKAFGVSMFTMDEVAAWAIERGLYPVPTRGDPEELCVAWENRLAQARSRYGTDYE